MFKIIRASLYKLFKDRPFKITLIIGVSLAVVFSLAYHFILPEMGSGYNMLISASSPSNNFGLAVPINLITFIIGEYNYGTIRNKMIAGNKRINIYIALFVMGLIYSLSMMTIYVGMSVGLSTILGGFYPKDLDPVSAKTILSIIGVTIMVYMTLTALSILAASAIRNIGGAITVTVLLIMLGYLVGMVITLNASLDFEAEKTTYPVIAQILDPIFFHSVVSLQTFGLGDISELLPLSLVSNGIYTTVFLAGGIALFQYRDVK